MNETLIKIFKEAAARTYTLRPNVWNAFVECFNAIFFVDMDENCSLGETPAELKTFKFVLRNCTPYEAFHVFVTFVRFYERTAYSKAARFDYEGKRFYHHAFDQEELAFAREHLNAAIDDVMLPLPPSLLPPCEPGS